MVSDSYPSIPLNKFDGRPIGKANFKEPVLRRGVFQNRYIEVEVTVYSGDVIHPQTQKKMTPVRFGEMNVIRLVDDTLLYNRTG